MSLTGANADKRYPMTPTQQKIALAKLYGKLNGSSVGGGTSDVDEAVDKVAAEIKKAGSKAVVEKPKYVRQGDAATVAKLVADMNAGRVGALIMDGVNPAYTLPNAEEFISGLEQVDVSVDFAYINDETAQASSYVAAASHYLESWGDA